MSVKPSLPPGLWFCPALVFILGLNSSSEPGFVRTKVNNNIVLLLPEEFQLMSEQDLNEKIITPRQSIALYTTPERRVDFGINQSTTSWSDSDFDLMKDFYKSNFMTFFSEVEFLLEDVEIINGRKFAVFEFLSVVRDQGNSASSGRVIRKYYYIQYTLVDSKPMIFNLSAPARERNEWSSRARTIMSSIKIK